MTIKPSSKADAVFSAAQKRDASIKEIAAKERAALDAKLAKLRALRLAKEEADKEAAKLNPAISPTQSKRARPNSA